MEQEYDTNPETLRLLRKTIPENIVKFLKNGRNKVLLLQYPPGIGKTTGAVKALIHKYAFGFFGVDHKSLEENVSDPYDMRHLKGKRKLCVNNKKELFMDYNLLNSNYICQAKCEHRRDCIWWLMNQEFYSGPESFVAVHQHIPTLSNFMTKNGYDVMVIDENFLDAMFNGGTLTNIDVSHCLTMLRSMKKTEERDFMIYFFKELNTLLLTKQMDIRPFRHLDLDHFKDEFQKMMVDKLYEGERLYEDNVSWVIDFLLAKNMKEIKRRTVTKNKKKKYLIEFLQYNFKPLDFEMPIIILDATTPKEVYEEIFKKFNKEVITVKPKVIAKSHTYQLTTHSYPMKFLSKEPIRNRLFDICENLCKKYPKESIFFCIRKAFEPYLKKRLENCDNALIAHYGGVRGANSYKESNIAVLIGTPFPNPDLMKLKSKAMGVREEYLYQMECNEEMNQTIHRIRPLTKADIKTQVYILSNTETDFHSNHYKELPITKMEEITKKKKKEID